MPLPQAETDMADFPFPLYLDLSQAKTPSPSPYTDPSCTDTSPDTPFHFFPPSNDPKSDTNSYFASPYIHSSWMYPHQDALDDSVFQSTPLSLDFSSSQIPYDAFSDPPSLFSSDSMDSSNHNADLANITECESWSAPSYVKAEGNVKDGDQSYSSSPSPYRQPDYSPYTTSAIEHTTRCYSYVAPVRFDSNQPHTRPQPSAQNQSQQPQQKRRKSLCSKPQQSSSTKTSAEPKILPEQTQKVPNPKPPIKTSHSIIERRYRENLNTRITELDRTLSSTRHSAKQSDGLGDEDRKVLEAPGKTRKADVLNEAMRYVQKSELDTEARTKEIDFLRLRVGALEKLVGCGDCPILKRASFEQTDF